MSTLLPFHKHVLEAIHDPATSDLVVLARGLGLRRVVCTLLKIYDSPKNLVLLVGASSEEETGYGEEMGLMGCRNPGLRIVGYEIPREKRQELYKGGGILSVTSRILVVDMLLGDLPVEMITGLVVLHAERVTPVALEAFIVRLFREKNRDGFVKGFTDQPEHITSGMSPLKNVMKELQVRRVNIYPRFHDEIKQCLERRVADVVELYPGMTENMSEIHHAIIQCMTGTLADLKRSNTKIELDDLNIDNAYFRQFDIIVRRQLDPVWHKVGPKTKQLVSDLTTLRNLLSYLLSYDALQFHAYLETLREADNTTAKGATKINHAPWMMTDAANIIFEFARRRCYTLSTKPKAVNSSAKDKEVIDLVDDEDAWAVLDESEGVLRDKGTGKGKGKAAVLDEQGEKRPGWLPRAMDPVLEELPKWDALAEIMEEIEGEIVGLETMQMERVRKGKDPIPGTNTTLIMTSSMHDVRLIAKYLASANLSAQRGMKGRKMMMDKLGGYLWWKRRLGMGKDSETNTAHGRNGGKAWSGMWQRGVGGGGGSISASVSGNATPTPGVSEALLKKDQERADKNKSRRRLRGGAPPSAGRSVSQTAPVIGPEDFEDLWATEQREVIDLTGPSATLNQLGDSFLDVDNEDISSVSLTLATSSGSTGGGFGDEFNEFYGLVTPEENVIVRAYSDDGDDRLLEEVQPRFVVMMEPCLEFIRRIEVYKNSHKGLAVRVYHMVYRDSCEEQKYLAAMRKEKESFEKLIRERGSLVMTIQDERREGVGRNDDMIKTISTRFAGGRRELNQEESRIIVDLREFRSALPSLLHAANIKVVPATLTVGDYILGDEMCVERKSLTDLVQSFTSGRLYTQCELMSVHYKYPILLIEFEEDKAFSLDLVTDFKSYAKPSGKYPTKFGGSSGRKDEKDAPKYTQISVQSKIVLLTLSFPRLRIIWSSSPFVTAEIFGDLKRGFAEPDVAKAVAVGAGENGEYDLNGNVGVGGNANANQNQMGEELLRSLPGITSKNARYVMGKVGSVKELCALSLEGLKEILGDEPGKNCWEFLHKGE
ncbi:hypothetical protein FA15DRAFT_669680 [Coprinopsis marcescibilis]|uniref:ERCC4 domain-containing protein n=1 Tax=Coprinopsis marcescibilis TaxID=230819 RepID=A0A5C3KUM4_COPMA|nr:hypothetical protein FA15DRAFT_669680 [Coprinopsis marcescibilis]